MFFNNKPDQEQEADIVVSDYALEKYKLSEYSKSNLPNKDIEIIFCKKTEWNESSNDVFFNTLKKHDIINSSEIEYITFPKDYESLFFNTGNFTRFKKCIFHGGKIRGSSLQFQDCDFLDVTTISSENDIRLDTVCSEFIIKIEDCSELSVTLSKIAYLKINKSAKASEIRLIDNTLSNGLDIESNSENIFIEKLEVIFSSSLYFSISSEKIDRLSLYKVNLSEAKPHQFRLSRIKSINELSLHSSSLPGLNIDQLNSTKKCNIEYCEIKNFPNTVTNHELNLSIYDSKINPIESYICNKGRFSFHIKDLCIIKTNLEKLDISNTPSIYLREVNSTEIDIRGDNERTEISHVETHDFSLTYLDCTRITTIHSTTVKNLSDFKFSSISKLAIYNSNFKAIDLDCSFIDQLRSAKLNGIDEKGNIVDLSENNFSSIESYNYLK